MLNDTEIIGAFKIQIPENLAYVEFLSRLSICSYEPILKVRVENEYRCSIRSEHGDKAFILNYACCLLQEGHFSLLSYLNIIGEFAISTQPDGDNSENEGGTERETSTESSSSDYKKNYTYEDWLREQQEEEIKKSREKAGAPNLAVSSLPAFASLEDVLRYFLYEESGIILDAGADKLEESLILHNMECVRIGPSTIALNVRKQQGFAGEVVVASITYLPFKEDSFVRCVSSKGLEGLSNTVEVTNALVELSRVCKTTIITLRQYGDSIVHRVIFTRMFVDRLVKGIGIHYGILRRQDGDFVIYLLSKGLQSPQSLAMEYAGEGLSQKVVGRAKAKQQLQKSD